MKTWLCWEDPSVQQTSSEGLVPSPDQVELKRSSDPPTVLEHLIGFSTCSDVLRFLRVLRAGLLPPGLLVALLLLRRPPLQLLLQPLLLLLQVRRHVVVAHLEQVLEAPGGR